MALTGTKGLLLWCQQVTNGYKDVSVTNMTKSWKDGLAFCAIIHHYRPDLLNFDNLSKENVAENNRTAFTVAEDELGIPALLDVEDMVAMPVPDKLSIMTYVSQYYNYFKDKTPGEIPPKAKAASKRRLPASNSSPPKRQAPDPTKVPGLSATKEVIGATPRPQLSKSSPHPCTACGKTVYLMERLSVEGKLFHRVCFKCSICGVQLRLGTYRYIPFEEDFLCDRHYKERTTSLGSSDAPKSPTINQQKEKQALHSLIDNIEKKRKASESSNTESPSSKQTVFDNANKPSNTRNSSVKQTAFDKARDVFSQPSNPFESPELPRKIIQGQDSKRQNYDDYLNPFVTPEPQRKLPPPRPQKTPESPDKQVHRSPISSHECHQPVLKAPLMNGSAKPQNIHVSPKANVNAPFSDGHSVASPYNYKVKKAPAPPRPAVAPVRTIPQNPVTAPSGSQVQISKNFQLPNQPPVSRKMDAANFLTNVLKQKNVMPTPTSDIKEKHVGKEEQNSKPVSSPKGFTNEEQPKKIEPTYSLGDKASDLGKIQEYQTPSVQAVDTRAPSSEIRKNDVVKQPKQLEGMSYPTNEGSDVGGVHDYETPFAQVADSNMASPALEFNNPFYGGEISLKPPPDYENPALLTSDVSSDSLKPDIIKPNLPERAIRHDDNFRAKSDSLSSVTSEGDRKKKLVLKVKKKRKKDVIESEANTQETKNIEEAKTDDKKLHDETSDKKVKPDNLTSDIADQNRTVGICSQEGQHQYETDQISDSSQHSALNGEQKGIPGIVNCNDVGEKSVLKDRKGIKPPRPVSFPVAVSNNDNRNDNDLKRLEKHSHSEINISGNGVYRVKDKIQAMQNGKHNDLLDAESVKYPCSEKKSEHPFIVPLTEDKKDEPKQKEKVVSASSVGTDDKPKKPPKRPAPPVPQGARPWMQKKEDEKKSPGAPRPSPPKSRVTQKTDSPKHRKGHNNIKEEKKAAQNKVTQKVDASKGRKGHKKIKEEKAAPKSPKGDEGYESIKEDKGYELVEEREHSREEIDMELRLIEKRQRELEKKGVEMEKRLRIQLKGEPEENYLIEWFELVNEKNKLLRRENELVYISQEMEYLENQRRVEFELRMLLEKDESVKTEEDKEKEEELLQQLVGFVQRRNTIVEKLEEDRIREKEEDEQIRLVMEAQGLSKPKGKNSRTPASKFYC